MNKFSIITDVRDKTNTKLAIIDNDSREIIERGINGWLEAKKRRDQLNEFVQKQLNLKRAT